jgi:RNA polymerase sigma factor (sigma-70 family)
MRPTDPATDGQLVARARQGDREAFGELVDRYRDMVYGLGYHLTGDFEAARDLAQEAFVQAFVKLGQLREPGKFSGWLRRIATNLHRAQARRSQVSTVALEAAAGAADVPPPSETRVVVREALARLRAPERLALTLAYVDGYSQAEIAGFLGVRTETVKTRLARARQHLRTEVVAMVKDAFGANSLGDTFRKDVIGTVRALERDLRRSLPPELPKLGEVVTEHWQRLLAEVREGLADRAGAGEAIGVEELPQAARERLALAVQWLWLDRIIFHLLNHTSELKDATWVGLARDRKRQRLLQLWGSADPKAGGLRGTTLPERPRRYQIPVGMPQGTAPTSQHELQARLVEDVRHAVAGLRAGMSAQLPVPAPELYAEVQHQFEKLAAAWLTSLGEDDRRRLEAGERVPFGELSDAAQEALRELAEVDWLRGVAVRLAVAPEWVSNLAECEITFDAREERTGAPGVKLEHPDALIMMGEHHVSAESSGDPKELKAVEN